MNINSEHFLVVFETYVAFTLQDHSLLVTLDDRLKYLSLFAHDIFLTFGHVHLRPCVEQLFSPVPLSFHLELKLALSVDELSARYAKLLGEEKNMPRLRG